MNAHAPVEEMHDPNGFAKRPRPLTALRAGAQLLMNLEDTQHIFTVFDAIDGPQTERNYQRYMQSAVGARLDAENVNFSDILSDKSYLRSFEAGTLAHSYLDFLSREDLDMELLVIAEIDSAASTLNVDPSRRNFIAGGFAIHDLLHVLTGYGRDAIGEACVLAFTAEQLDLRGVRFMASALAIREKVKQPNKPVLAMIREAEERAANALWAPEIDWRDYLGLPLNEARVRLGIKDASVYPAHQTGPSPQQGKAGDKPLQRAA